MENTEEKKEARVSLNEIENNNQESAVLAETEKPASPLDAIKLDKKSLEILEETEEDDL